MTSTLRSWNSFKRWSKARSSDGQTMERIEEDNRVLVLDLCGEGEVLVDAVVAHDGDGGEIGRLFTYEYSHGVSFDMSGLKMPILLPLASDRRAGNKPGRLGEFTRIIEKPEPLRCNIFVSGAFSRTPQRCVPKCARATTTYFFAVRLVLVFVPPSLSILAAFADSRSSASSRVISSGLILLGRVALILPCET